MPTINPIIKRAGTTQPDDGAYLNPDSRVGVAEVKKSSRERCTCHGRGL